MFPRWWISDLPGYNCRPQFYSLGVDCFSPRTERRWGIASKCLSRRCVHLGLLEKLDADDFLLSMQRFTSTRDTDAPTFTERSQMHLHYEELSSWHWKMICLIVCVVNLVNEPECLDVISDYSQPVCNEDVQPVVIMHSLCRKRTVLFESKTCLLWLK